MKIPGRWYGLGLGLLVVGWAQAQDSNVMPAASSPLAASTEDVAASPDAVTWQQMNAVFGLPIWMNDNLFNDRGENVAARLGWKEESATPETRSYRLYAGDSVRVLGARPYSLALYSAGDKVEQLSMVFANKGDYEGFAGLSTLSPPADDKLEQLIREFSAKVRSDGDLIAKNLTQLLGPPESTFFGVGSGMQEKMLRWDWKGHAFLLGTPRLQYVLLRIMTVERADNKGRVEKVSAEEMKQLLSEKVERRANGDVVIRDIPMVDQGPKGYCVPATWERFLRYLGIPADMYVLAMSGSTALGGGTSIDSLEDAVAGLVSAYGRSIQNLDETITLRVLKKYIDQGIPLMWCCGAGGPFEGIISDRTKERRAITDWDSYKTKILEVENAVKKSNQPIPTLGGHMRMIVGYNPDTLEVAISDSWGPTFAERWMTIEEARKISEGPLIIIKW